MDLQTFFENFDTIAEAPGGIDKLRSLILDLAYSGKLTSQFINIDNTVFIQKIFQERERLLKGLNFRNSKTLKDEVSKEEQLFDIPDHWRWIRIGHAFLISSGTTPSRKHPEYFQEGTECWVKTTDLNNDVVLTCEEKITRQAVKDCNLKKYPVNTVCVALYGGSGTIGKSGILGIETTINQSVCGIYPNKSIEPRYFHWYLKLIRPLWMKFAASLRKAPNINAGVVNNMLLPMTCLEEQQQIVAMIDELMVLCDRLQAAQEKRDRDRQKLRASALDALMNAPTDDDLDQSWAFVRDRWDDLNQQPEDVKEMRSLILDLAVRGKLVPCSTAVQHPLKRFLSFQNGYAFKSGWYQSEGIRLVRNQNISHGILDWQDVKYVDTKKAQEYSRFALLEGDIVLSLDRPIISTGLKIARVKKQDLPSLLLQRVARPIISNQSLSAEYLYLWFKSSAFLSAIDPGRSNGVPHISTRAIESLEIRVPALTEQKRIVAKVDELMALCDRLETSLRQSQEKASALASAATANLEI